MQRCFEFWISVPSFKAIAKISGFSGGGDGRPMVCCGFNRAKTPASSTTNDFGNIFYDSTVKVIIITHTCTICFTSERVAIRISAESLTTDEFKTVTYSIQGDCYSPQMTPLCVFYIKLFEFLFLNKNCLKRNLFCTDQNFTFKSSKYQTFQSSICTVDWWLWKS